MSNTIIIESLEREITFWQYTHKIAREYKNALLEWVIVGTNQTGDTPSIDLPITNQMKAEEIQIMGITWLTRNDLDKITEEEYDLIRDTVANHINTKKK